MATKGSWIPKKEWNFVGFCENWEAAFKKPETIESFGWDMDEVTVTMNAIHVFLTARAAYVENNSTKNRIAKDDAMAAAKSAIRDFANTSIRFNKKMWAGDKAVFGILPPDRTASPVTGIESFPEAESDTSIIRQVTIRFWDSVTKKRAKPRGVHGAEIRWMLLDNAPASVDELIHSDFDTASPFTLRFGEPERGKKLFYCLRWETTTNEKGPFGPIMSSIIP